MGHSNIDLYPRRGAKNVTLRRRGDGTYRVTYPADMDTSRLPAIVEQLLKRMASTPAPAPRPARHYEWGQQFKVLDTTTVTIKSWDKPRAALKVVDGKGYVIYLSESADIANPKITNIISKILMNFGRMHMPLFFATEAHLLAAMHHCQVSDWGVGRGLRTLGTCSSRRKISFSPAVVYLTEAERKHIICHELAHLKHMNHSEVFHARLRELLAATPGAAPTKPRNTPLI